MRTHALPLYPIVAVTLLVALIALATGCGKKPAAAAGVAKPVTSKPVAAKLAGAKAAAPESAAAPAPATVAVAAAPPTIAAPAQWSKHHKAALAIRDQLVIGELAGATAPAQWLATYQPAIKVTSAAQPALTQLHASAQAIAKAPDLPTAIKAVSAMVASCSACHNTIDGGIIFAVLPPPVPAASTKAHMKGHVWGLHRMWAGLVGPDEQLWRAGAQALTRGDGDPASLEALVKDTPGLTGLVKRVHDHADAALKQTDVAAKSATFGALIGTCATCHNELAAGPRDAVTKWP